jgi:hypothetical protein
LSIASNGPGPALRPAAARAQQLAEAHGWSPATVRCTIDGLTVVLDGRPAGEHVTLTEVRTRTPRRASSPRVAEVLADLGLLDDDTTPAIRQWIRRRASELPAGFAEAVRAWLGVLLDGDARTRPRSQPTLYVFFGAVRPFLERWPAQRGHLREITAGDVDVALEPLRGHQRRNAITALRSLFRFAKRRGLVFANPTLHIATARIDPIRHLPLDDLDLPNRRITIAGHTQRLGELTDRALRAWLEQRRTAWPHTPNRHVLVSEKTALGVAPISKGYFHYHLRRHGFDLDRIRKDRILHETLN